MSEKHLFGVAFDVKADDGFVNECINCCRNGMDVCLLREESRSDAEHDNNIHTIKKIASQTDFILLVSGGVKRLEDVKKFLYAGANAVILPESHPVYEEAVKRFGTDKVWTDSSVTVDGDTVEYITEMYVDKDINVFDLKFEARKNGKNVNLWESSVSFDEFKLNSDGLIPVIVQDALTDEVLMLAYMNREAFKHTISYGRMTYFSRSRQSLWVKGETSGHYQYVRSLHLDCDNDTLLAKVYQVGAACHTGAYSCFFRELVSKPEKNENPYQVLQDVYGVILDRKANPKEGSYTNYLFDKGIDKILKKVGEEATEIIIAAKNPEPEEIIYEISDFLYHVMVLMAEKNVTWEEITRELANR